LHNISTLGIPNEFALPSLNENVGCIEHVVVHELAHLLVPNHSPRFYAVMDKFFPRWKEAREETKRISRMENDTL
jgi:predicted metal-dependent hydrolase